jgi:hypothetical protein
MKCISSVLFEQCLEGTFEMLLVRSDKVSGLAQRINKSRLAGTAYTNDRDQFIHKANYKTVYSALCLCHQGAAAPQCTPPWWFGAGEVCSLCSAGNH